MGRKRGGRGKIAARLIKCWRPGYWRRGRAACGSCGREVGSPRCSPVVASLPETPAAALTPSAKGVGGRLGVGGVGEGPQRWSGK